MPIIRPQNLNETFYAAAKQARQKAPDLSHSQKVAHLYRHSLKLLLSWVIDRNIFNKKATQLRQRFDANRGVPQATAHRLLMDGQDELFTFFHPDMYRNCYMPGGSKFMRNPPLPMSVCFPDGNLPDDAPLYEYNPDMSVCKPGSGRNNSGSVLIDFSKKNME